MPTKKSTAKKKAAVKPAKKTAAKKKAVVKKTAAKKAVAKKSPAKKVATKKTAVKKAAVKKATTKKAAVKKATPKKATAKKPVTKKAVTKKTPMKKSSSKTVSKTTAKAPAKKAVTKKPSAPASKVAAKPATKSATKSPAKATPAKASVTRPKPNARPKTTMPIDALDKPNHFHMEVTPEQQTAAVASGFMGIPPYALKADEEYMNEPQVEHFRKILLTWKQALMEEVDRTVHHMQDEAANFPDPSDRATQEEEFSLELRTRDRERKLIKKIDEALQKLKDDDYGYCDMCGIEIGVRRLEARPTANLCIDCKTMDEIRERQGN